MTSAKGSGCTWISELNTIMTLVIVLAVVALWLCAVVFFCIGWYAGKRLPRS